MSNPLLPSNVFVPDVEAHVWEDGRIYLYGSYDLYNDDYCSDCYHVYSSNDMVNWIDHGVSFSISDTKWAKDQKALYAPDCAYRNGWYYLYYCVPDGRCGVAKSQSPIGPFEDVGPIDGVWGIDPAAFVDDDGQAYLYWGQLTWGKVAKLKENMVEIEPDTVRESLSVDMHEFHEGSTVKKINGKYYFVFADTHRHGNRPTCLGYAVSDNPMTDFKYKGVIIDNFKCDPFVWNNHGSIECFNGQWYVFYHRSTHGTKFLRRVCAEPIYFNDDGTILEVEQTSSGIEQEMSASMKLKADIACKLDGNVYITYKRNIEKGNYVLSNIRSNDAITFKYLNFSGEDVISVDMKCDNQCRIEIYLDDKYHEEILVEPTDIYTVSRHTIPNITGRHVVTFRIYGSFNEAYIKNFQFFKSTNL